jgi:hypothetical protein
MILYPAISYKKQVKIVAVTEWINSSVLLVSLMKTAIFLIVAIAALGAVGITTAILSAATPVHADSCARIIAGCHGCAPSSNGDTKSVGKCFNR